MSERSAAKQALLARLKDQALSRASSAEETRLRITRNGDAEYTASSGQRRIWLHEQLNPDTAMYHIPLGMRIAGELDANALEHALARIISRHESLRTGFAMKEGVLRAAVFPYEERSFRLERQDASGSPEGALASMLTAESAIPFRLDGGPLMRAKLFTLSEHEHVLLLCLHHIAADGWSIGVLFRELKELYEAQRNGRESLLPSLPIQYGDYADWQQAGIESAHLKEQRAYWKERLHGAPPQLEWRTDYPRTGNAAGTGRSIPFVVSALTTERLNAVCQDKGVTLFMVLMSVYRWLLEVYSRQEDIVIGVPVAGRDAVETEGLVGFFVNMLALRIDSSGAVTFRDLLQSVRNTTIEAYERQEVPFDLLVDELGVERDSGANPLFQAIFSFNNALSTESIADLQWILVPIDTGTAKYDIAFELWPEGGHRLGGRLDYRSDLFREETMQRFLACFETVLEQIANDPAVRLSDIRLLTPEEQAEQMRGPRTAGLEEKAAFLLHERFELAAASHPERSAVTFGGESISYEELNRRANRIAHALRKLDIGADDLVGLYFHRSFGLVEAIVGVLKAGGAYVPIDPTSPRDRIAFILQDTKVKVLLTERELLEEIPATEAAVLCLDDPALAAESELNLEPLAKPEHLAYVIYTSGSTGTPKGVLIEHRQVARLFRTAEQHYQFGADDVWTLFHSYAFDFSVWELWGALLYGGRLVVVPYVVSRSPDDFCRLASDEAVTVLNQTPTAFNAFMRSDESVFGSSTNSLSSIRYIIFGGEALDPGRLKLWFDRHGSSARLVNMYGITETTVHVTYREITAADTGAASISIIGEPLADLSLYLLDRTMNLVPGGVPGEIYIGGDGLARGYLNRPELTNERFVANPFVPGGRLYRTGDLARRLPDGELEYLGRCDLQVKIRGFRIELGEIAHRITEHPDVRDGAVIVREDGNGNRRLAAFVVARDPEAPPQLSELLQALKQSLPDYMIPSVFLLLSEIPVNQNGKADTRALERLASDNAVMISDSESEQAEPSGETEQELAEIWRRVLSRERVGANDNFFALGGDSILAIQAAELAKERGIRFELPDLFRHQTVRSLAAVILQQQQDKEERCPATAAFHGLNDEVRSRMPSDVEDAYPLTQLQLGMLYHMEFSEKSTSYLNTAGFRIRGPFVEETLQRAIDEVVKRHPVLRTSFDFSSYGEPLQLVHTDAKLRLRAEDLRHLREPDREQALKAWNEAELAARFDLSKAPLLRMTAHRLDDSMFHFGIAECHAVLDGWSLTSILREIFEVYLAELEGTERPAYAAAKSTFRDFIWWEREIIGSADHRTFWIEQMDAFTPTTVPVWNAAKQTSIEARSFQRHAEALSQETERALRKLAADLNVPFKSVLLTAHFKALSVLNNRQDVVTGVVVNGRPEEGGGERIRGLFLNTVPLRQQLESGSWRMLIRSTFEKELEIMPHRRYPLYALQKALGGRELFETSFNFVHFRELQKIEQSGKLSFTGISEEADTNFTMQASFSVLPTTGQLVLMLDTNGNAVAREQGEAIAGYYMRILRQIAADPDATHDGFCPLSDREREQLLVEWNRTEQELGGECCVHELIEEYARLMPDTIAVTVGGETLAFGELNWRADQLAVRLREAGVGPDVPVGILMDRTVMMPVAVLGVLKAGGAYVPLDPTYPVERLAYMASDSGAPVIVAERAMPDWLPGYAGRWIEVSCFETVEAAEGPVDGQAESTALKALPSNLAYMIYTSGSTGMPKGVMIEHRNAVNYIRWASDYYAASEGSGAPVHSSLAFDLTVTSLLVPLASGRAVSLVPEAKRLEGLGEAMAAQPDFSLVKITPAHLGLLGTLVEPAQAAKGARTLVIGGEQLMGEPLRWWRMNAPGTRLINEYGPTETTVGCCIYEVTQDEELGGPVPIGRPIANTRLYVLNEAMQPVPVGVTGELYIGGAGVARGYWNRPELTKERFVDDPFVTEPGGTLYRTGDWVRYRPDGVLEYIGRKDDQVKVKGYRIELGEVEAGLAGCPGVRELAVAVREGASGEKRLVAYAVRESGAEAEPNWRAYAKGRLAEHMVPAAWVWLDKLPLTVNGKVDRQSLPDPVTEQDARAETPAQAEGPRNETEVKLAAIWNEVLGTAGIGVHDNFFERGGDSILAFQVVSKAKAAGIAIKPRHLFEHPTIALLAEAAVGLDTADLSAVDEEEDTAGSLISTPIIHWFFEQQMMNPNHYNQSMFFQVPADMDEHIVEQICGLLVRRHDALRIRSGRIEDGVNGLQVVEDAPAAIRRIDISMLDDDAAAKSIELGCNETQASLDVANGPLFAATLFYRGANRTCYLLLAAHHLAVDGVSWRIMLEEWLSAYTSLAQGGQPVLPARSTSFRRWAAWLNRFAQSDEVKADAAYWAKQAQPEFVPVPLDNSEGLAAMSDASMVTVRLDAEETRQLLQEANRTYRTRINDLLLAALAASLESWTGRGAVVFDLEGHGREEEEPGIELHQTVGWFTSMYPVLLDLRTIDSSNLEERIKTVKEQLRKIPRNGLTYGLLRYLSEDSGTRKLLGELPARQIRFNYLGVYDATDGLNNESVLVPHSAGRMTDLRNPLSHPLGIDGIVLNGELELTWMYSSAQLNRATVEMLAERYLAELRKLIRHCMQTDTVSLSPSDFPNARISQQELNRIMAKFSVANRGGK